MAHEISIREDGFAEMAYVGDTPWHKLGQQLTPNSPLEVWKQEAGLDWDVYEARVLYVIKGFGAPIKDFPDRKVLYRGDNGKPLSIVSDEFKIVQPGETLEFFRDLIESHGMRLQTAGALFGGRRFWALADTGFSEEVIANDPIKSYLFFSTSVDGTLATTARFTSIRVVCNNTMQIAMTESQHKNVVRKTHRSIWDSRQAKIDLGILSENFELFMDKLRHLSNFQMDPTHVKEFLKDAFYDPKREDEEQTWGAKKKAEKAWELYHTGKGAELAYGTAYGVLNAVTDLATHTGTRNQDNQFWKAMYDADPIKQKVFEDLLKLSEYSEEDEEVYA